MSGVSIDVRDNVAQAARRVDKLQQTLDKISKPQSLSLDIGDRVQRQTKGLNKNLQETSNKLGAVRAKGRNAFSGIEKEGNKAFISINKLSSAVKGLALSFGSLAGVATISSASDNLRSLQNRLTLVTSDINRAKTLQAELIELSRASNASLDNTVNLYVDFQQSLAKKGVSDKRIKDAVQTVLRSGALSGSSPESVTAGIRQLTQAISGSLRGEELSSVMEQLKFLGLGLKDVLNKDTQALREFAAAGGITSEVLLDVLDKLGPKANKAFANLEVPIGLATKKLFQTISILTGEITQRFGFDKTLVKAIAGVDKATADFGRNFNGYLIQGRGYFRSFEKEAKTSLEAVSANMTELLVSLDTQLNGLATLSIKDRKEGESLDDFRLRRAAFEEEQKLLVQNLSLRQAFQRVIERNATIQRVLAIDTKEFVATLAALDSGAAVLGVRLAEDFTSLFKTVLRIVGEGVQSLRVTILRFTDFANDLTFALTKPLSDEFHKAGGIIDRFNKQATIDGSFAEDVQKLFNTRNVEDFFKQTSKVAQLLRTSSFNSLKNLFDTATRDLDRFNRNVKDATTIINGIEVAVPTKGLEVSANRIKAVYENLYTQVFNPQLKATVADRLVDLDKKLVTFSESFSKSFDKNSGEAVADKFLDFIRRSISNISAALSDVKGFSLDKLFELGGVSSTTQSSIEKSVTSVFGDLTQYVEGFLSTFAQKTVVPVSQMLKRLISRLYTDLVQLIAIQLRKLSVFIFEALSVTTDLSLLRVTAPDALFDPLIALFEELPLIAQNGLGKTIKLLGEFAKNAKAYFLDVYVDVVGNSTWPDLIDGVNDHTKDLAKSESRISQFGERIKALFASAFRQVSSKQAIQELFANLGRQIERLDIASKIRNLSENILGALISLIAIVFGSPKIALVGTTALVSLITNILGDVVSPVANIFGVISERILELVGPLIIQGIPRLLNLLLEKIPLVLDSILDAISPMIKDALGFLSTGGLIDFGEIFGVALIGLTAFVLGAERPLATLGSLLVKLTASIVETTAAWLGFNVAGKIASEGSLAIGVGVLAASLLEGLGLLEASIIAIPAIVGGFFGPAVAARLFLTLVSALKFPIVSAISFVAKLMGAGEILEAFRKMFEGLGVQTVKSAAAVNLTPTQVILRQKLANLLGMFKGSFQRFVKNAEFFGNNQINLLDALFTTVTLDKTTGAVKKKARASFRQVFNEIGTAFLDLTGKSGNSLRGALKGLDVALLQLLVDLRFNKKLFKSAFSGLAFTLKEGISLLLSAATSKVGLVVLALGSIFAFAGDAEAANEQSLESGFSNPIKHVFGGILNFLENFNREVIGIFNNTDSAFTNLLGDLDKRLGINSDIAGDTLVGATVRFGQLTAGLVALKLAFVAIRGSVGLATKAFRTFTIARNAALVEFGGELGIVKQMKGAQAGIAGMTAGFIRFSRRTEKQLFWFGRRTVFNPEFWSTSGAALFRFFALFTQGIKGVTKAALILKGVLLAIIAPIKGLLAIAAVVTSVSIIGGILFGDDGNGNTLESRIDVLIDKARLLAGITPKGQFGREQLFLQKIQTVEVGGQTFDFSPIIRKLDLASQSTRDVERLEGFLEEALDVFKDLDKEFKKNGRLVESQTRLLDATARDVESLLRRQRQKPIANVDDLREDIARSLEFIPQSFANFAKRFVGEKPIETRAQFEARSNIDRTAAAIQAPQRAIVRFLNAIRDTFEFFSERLDILNKAAGLPARIPSLVGEVFGALTLKISKAIEDKIAAFLEGTALPISDQFKVFAANLDLRLAKISDIRAFVPETDVAAVLELSRSLLEAGKLVEVFKQGFDASRDNSLQSFKLKQKIASASLAKLQVEFDKKSLELIKLGREEKAIETLQTKLTDFADRAKTAFESDFGSKGEDFIGGSATFKVLDSISDKILELDKQLLRQRDLDLRSKVQVDRAILARQAKAIADVISENLTVFARIELQAGELELEGLTQALTILRRSSKTSSDSVAKLFDQLRRFKSTDLPTDASQEQISALEGNIRRIRASILESIPTSEIAENLNKALSDVGAEPLKPEHLLGLAPADFSAIATSVKDVVIAREKLQAFADLEGTPAFSNEGQLDRLKSLQRAIAATNSITRRSVGDSIDRLAANSSLPILNKALKLSELIGVELTREQVLKLGGIEQFFKVRMEMEKINQQLLEMQANAAIGLAVDLDSFIALNKRLEELDESLKDVKGSAEDTADAVTRGLDEMLGGLTTAGFNASLQSIMHLPRGTRKELADIALEITEITRSLNETDPRSSAFEKLASRQAELVRNTQAFSNELLTNSGAAIQEFFERVGLFDANLFKGTKAQVKSAFGDVSRIITSEFAELEKIQVLDVALAGLRADLKTVGSLKEFADVRKQFFETERAIAFAVDDLATTFITRVPELNDVFKSSLDIFSFAGLGGQARDALTATAKIFKRELENIERTGETISGATIEAFVKSFRAVTRVGPYLDFFKDTQQNLENAILEGAASGIDRINELSGVSFDKLDLQLFGGRRELAVELTNIDALERAMNLPGLTEEMAKTLNGVEFSSIDSVMAKFSSQFGVDLESLTKTPLELNNAVVEANTTALQEMTSALRGETFNPGALLPSNRIVPGSGSGEITSAALVTPILARLETLTQALSSDANLRTSAGLLSQVTGVNIEADTLNRATEAQLAAIREVSLTISAKTKELISRRASGLPVDSLQSEIDAYTAQLDLIPSRIRGNADRLRTAGSNFAGDVNKSFETGLTGALKGESGIISGLLDSLTSGVISTFSKGIVGQLTGTGGILEGGLNLLGTGIAGLFNPNTGDDVNAGVVGAIEASSVLQEGFFMRLGGVFTNGLKGLGSMLGNLATALGGLFGGGGGKDLGSTIFGFLGLATSLAGAASGGLSGASARSAQDIKFPASQTFNFARGGKINGAGTGTSDSILARLSNGEFVINAQATNKHLQLLDMINKDRLPAFASGGLVGTKVPAIDRIEPVARENADGNSSQVFNMQITGDISRQTRAEVAKMIPMIASQVNNHNRERRLIRS